MISWYHFLSLDWTDWAKRPTNIPFLGIIFRSKSTFPDAHIWSRCGVSLLSAIKYPFKSVNNELRRVASYYFNKMYQAEQLIQWCHGLLPVRPRPPSCANLSRPDLYSIYPRLPPHSSITPSCLLPSLFSSHPSLSFCCTDIINRNNPLKCLAQRTYVFRSMFESLVKINRPEWVILRRDNWNWRCLDSHRATWEMSRWVHFFGKGELQGGSISKTSSKIPSSVNR